MCSNLHKDILDLERQIKLIKEEQSILTNKLKILQSKKDELQSELDLEKIKNRPDTDEWITRKFSWSEQINKILIDKFKFHEFKPKQLAAVNATLDKKDVLLLMPTGGGKSLAYQLPAIVDKGLTLVISPLISLIEDQLIALEKFGIKAASINGSSSKEHKRKIHTSMATLGKDDLKLLYVTPEWLAKSKIFMSYLQKCFAAGNLDRIAIDEVHCCSTWGHDFRTEYNYLGLLKPMFPGVPFIGLTATATMSILIDIQKMLGMEDCTIITAPFNRPNLYYKVLQKPSEIEDSICFLEKMMKGKYNGQSGIIYTTTIRETEDLTSELRKRGLKVNNYHAQLEHETKKTIHERWLSNKCQAVIATIAFGMGIDKADVRFVIHYSVPKSMEGFYQESGRAGRDGKRADCILMLSLANYLKVLGMASSKIEETNALAVLNYCMEVNKCRRSVIASHFQEVWDASNCNKMCDYCKNKSEVVYYNIKSACLDIFTILEAANKSDCKLTLLKLINCWFHAGCKEFKLPNIVKPKISKSEAEKIIAFLLLKNYLKLEKNYTMYSVIFYFQKNKQTVGDIEMPLSSNENLKGFQKRSVNEVIDLDNDEPPRKKIHIDMQI